MVTKYEIKGKYSIIKDSNIEEGTIVWNYANIFNSKIGKKCIIGSHTEIGGAEIGDYCKIEAYCFIPHGIKIGNNVFVGPRTTFTNDKYPEARGDWKPSNTIVEDYASIGAGSIILPGIKIKKNSKIGAGSIVTKDTEEGFVYLGNPARKICTVEKYKNKKLESLR